MARMIKALLVALCLLVACSTSAVATPRTHHHPPKSTALPPPRPVVAIVGDSYVAGFGTTCGCQSQAWFQYTANDLGWQIGNVIADPGAGFVHAGQFGTFAQALQAHPLPATTDFVLVQGGFNDNSVDPDLVPAAVANVLSIIHNQAPNAVPIVIGAVQPTQSKDTSFNQLTVARQIGAGNAIGSTRYMIGFMATFEVTADDVHPTDTGHHQFGDWVAWHAGYGLDNGKELVWRPVLGWWTT